MRDGNLRYDGSHPLTAETYIRVYDRLSNRTILGNALNGGFHLSADEGHWRFAVADQAGFKVADSNLPIALNQRVHLAGVFDGKQVRLFVNGHLQQDWRRLRSVHKARGADILVGANPNDGDGRTFYKPLEAADVDCVRLSRSVRYTEDFTPPDRLAADDRTMLLFQFDEGEGTHATDTSGSNFHGVIDSAEWIRMGIE